jgi:hypothetical protein
MDAIHRPAGVRRDGAQVSVRFETQTGVFGVSLERRTEPRRLTCHKGLLPSAPSY